MGAPIGNQNGKKAKRWSDALTRALAKAGEGQGLEAGLDRVAAQVVNAAIDGDKDAWKEIGDRLDGKPAQAIIGGDSDDPAVQVAARIELVSLDK